MNNTPRAESEGTVPDSLHEIVEGERSRLMRVDAVLGSIVFALSHAEWHDESGTDYANAVQAARGLVQESVTRLDRINLESPARERTQD